MKKDYNGEQVARIAKAVKRKDRFMHKFLKERKTTFEELEKNEQMLEEIRQNHEYIKLRDELEEAKK
jgi:hypothetical protein